MLGQGSQCHSKQLSIKKWVVVLGPLTAPAPVAHQEVSCLVEPETCGLVSATLLPWDTAWSLILTWKPFTWAKHSLQMKAAILLGDPAWSCHTFCTWDHNSLWLQLRHVKDSFLCDEFRKGQVKMFKKTTKKSWLVWSWFLFKNMKDAQVSEAKCGEEKDFIFITFPFKKKEKKNHLPVTLTKKKRLIFQLPKGL